MKKMDVDICRYGNVLIFIFLAVYFFLIPFCLIIAYINDAGLNSSNVPKFIYSLHRSLSPKYERWAKERIKSAAAEQLDIENISGTEWPMFGSMFYLMATESLQEQWEKDKTISTIGPADYAAGAIKAATELMNDPTNATWVKKHWGEDYLHEENVFYRMLLISGCTSYQKLLKDNKYQALLLDQIETLSKSLDESPYGLLDDYPSQCFPTDVVAAIAAIKRADAVCGTDHNDFIKRSVRAFTGDMVDETGLPPYMADADTGIIDIARGCSNQWMTVWAPALWPNETKQWYDNFEKYFWQKRFGAVGFREFDISHRKSDWYFDVDSGPVVAGYGAAACAFGVGAARVNGRFDHAYPLGAEIIALSWPLADGTLLIPRILSNSMCAPYLGQAAILFNFTRMPAEGIEVRYGGSLPAIVYVALSLYLVVALVMILSAICSFRKSRKSAEDKFFPFAGVQFWVWLILIISGIIAGLTYHQAIGIFLLLLGQFLPQGFKRKAHAD